MKSLRTTKTRISASMALMQLFWISALILPLSLNAQTTHAALRAQARMMASSAELSGNVEVQARALALIPVCLEHGLKREAQHLADAVGRAAVGTDSNSVSAVEIELRFRQAQVLARNCEAEEAGRRLVAVQKLIPSDQPNLQAECSEELGMLAAWSGDYEKAQKHYGAAISNRQARTDAAGLGRVYNMSGVAHLQRGELMKATAAFDSAGRAFHQSKDRRGQEITRLNTAALQLASGEPARAHETLLRVLAFSQATDQPDIEAMAEGNLAAVLERVGRYGEALQHAGRSQQLYEQMDDCRTAGRVHNTLGVLHRKQGDFSKSANELAVALELTRQHGDRMGELAVRNNQAWLALALNQPQQGRDALLTIRSERRDAGDLPGEADALENLGAASLAMTNLADARMAFNEALVIRREQTNTTGVASLLINLGACEVKAGRPAQAIPLFREARELSFQRGALALQASAWNGLGVAFRMNRQFDDASAAYEQARLLQAQTGDPVAEAVTLNNLMVLAQRREQSAAAIFYGKLSVTRFQQVRARLKWLPVESQQSFTGYCQPAYRRLADLLVQSGRLAEAQQVITMLKDEERFEFLQRDAGVAERLNAAVGETATEAMWSKKYDQITQQVVALAEERSGLFTKAGARTPKEAKRLSELDDQLGAARMAMKEFLNLIHSQGEGRLELAQKNLYDVKAMQATLKALGDGTVLLHYVVGPEHVRIILTTPTVQVGRSAAVTEKELNQKVFAFQQVLKSGRLLDPLPQAQELFDLLIRPVEADLRQARAQTLVVSLDGTLRYLPLATLHDRKSYLIERYGVALFTEAGKDKLLLPAQRDWAVNGFGLTRQVGRFGALPFVRDELEGIIRQASGNTGVLPGQVWLDQFFDQTRLGEALNAGQPVLHIASHFVFSPGTVEKSYLLLGDGSELSLAEVERRDLRFDNMDLITLSACETAVSEVNPGNGLEVEGFTAVAQRQGAKGILATLWPVNDESTALLMCEFYRLRAANPSLPKLEALRQAQLQLLNGKLKPTSGERRRGATVLDAPQAPLSTDFTHPYYWGPFVLTGNWR